MIDTSSSATDQPARRVRLILNPVSGALGALPQLPLLTTALERAGYTVIAVFTQPDQSGTELAQQAVQEQYDLVVVAGGDGTVSAVAQGLFHTGIPLGIVPIGTYNNIARSLGIPVTFDEALEVLTTGRTWNIDAASANGVPFMEVAGVGLDARLFPVAEQIKSGAWFQVLNALKTLRYHRPRKVRIEFEDGKRITRRPMMSIISNMPYFGIGFAVAPTARPDSGKLVLSLFERMTKFELLGHFIRIANGRTVREPRITTFQAERFRIAATVRKGLPVQVDGRTISRTPVVFEVIPQALKVVVPQASDTA